MYTLLIIFFFIIIPKRTIATILLKLEDAIKVIGIPFSTPYPISYNFIIEGAKTARLTAPNMQPIERPKVKGISKIITAKTPQIKASDIRGTNTNQTTPKPNYKLKNFIFNKF